MNRRRVPIGSRIRSVQMTRFLLTRGVASEHLEGADRTHMAESDYTVPALQRLLSRHILVNAASVERLQAPNGL